MRFSFALAYKENKAPAVQYLVILSLSDFRNSRTSLSICLCLCLGFSSFSLFHRSLNSIMNAIAREDHLHSNKLNQTFSLLIPS